jgi:hypothetical protein
MSSSNPFGSSLRMKLWMRRMSISAPRMTIRTRMPWYWRLAFTVVVVAVGGAGALWAYDLGRSLAGINPGATRQQVADLKDELEKLRIERDQYSTTVNSAESQLNIEKSAQKQLVTQVKTLEAENTKLTEDLAFFESLLPADTGPLGVSIRRVKAEVVAPNQLRYRLLIMQGGKGTKDFAGNLQLVVTVIRDGKSAMMVFPDGKTNEEDKFKLGFKHYQRMEGVLTLPDGVTIKAVQARVLQNGQIRAQQAATL